MVAAERAVAEIAIMAFVIARDQGCCGAEINCDWNLSSVVLKKHTDILALNEK